MLGFRKTIRFLNAALRNQMVPKASMKSDPPKETEIVTPVLYNVHHEQNKPAFRFLSLGSHLDEEQLRHTAIELKEQGIAMTVLFTALLGPAFWILAHLEDYKNRPSD